MGAQGLCRQDEETMNPVVAKNVARRRRWRIARITILAVGLYVVFRILPTGTNLSHMDFQVQGDNALEMCDPANPQFLPVVNVRSPVDLKLKATSTPRAGEEVDVVITLATSSGKPISPADLLKVHTRLLHLMIIDPQMMDYHHVHPRPLSEEGKWGFSFTPRYGGDYHFFADFTPAATRLGLYANADLTVEGDAPSEDAVRVAHRPSWEQLVEGYRFVLEPSQGLVRANEEALIKLTVVNDEGGEVPLRPVMGAYAHVVAFDAARTGFAHLHPQEVDLSVLPDPVTPSLTFRVTIPQPGRYVTWAQVNIGGTELFAPFWFEVK